MAACCVQASKGLREAVLGIQDMRLSQYSLPETQVCPTLCACHMCSVMSLMSVTHSIGSQRWEVFSNNMHLWNSICTCAAHDFGENRQSQERGRAALRAVQAAQHGFQEFPLCGHGETPISSALSGNLKLCNWIQVMLYIHVALVLAKMQVKDLLFAASMFLQVWRLTCK